MNIKNRNRRSTKQISTNLDTSYEDLVYRFFKNFSSRNIKPAIENIFIKNQ